MTTPDPTPRTRAALTAYYATTNPMAGEVELHRLRMAVEAELPALLARMEAAEAVVAAARKSMSWYTILWGGNRPFVSALPGTPPWQEKDVDAWIAALAAYDAARTGGEGIADG